MPPVVVSGIGVASAFGRGRAALSAGLGRGEPGFAPVTRFDAGRYRVGVAATLADAGSWTDEIDAVVEQACAEAGLSRARRSGTPLLLGWHPDPDTVRSAMAGGARPGGGARAVALAERCGFSGVVRTYTTACVSSSTAIADACAMISSGAADRVLVTAGYLVDEDYFACFDAGRALAADGVLRPFSAGRQGLLLGDGVAAVVLESQEAAKVRGARAQALILGWGRGGDAFHVCQPHPEGVGLARAVRAAMTRAGVGASDIGYVNAHGTGTPYNDSAEAAGLHRAFGTAVSEIPVSSTKSMLGHTLEASGVLELAIAVDSATTGRLPVNAGFLGPDEEHELALVLDPDREAKAPCVLSLNAAFGGANTALVVTAP